MLVIGGYVEERSSVTPLKLAKEAKEAREMKAMHVSQYQCNMQAWFVCLLVLLLSLGESEPRCRLFC